MDLVGPFPTQSQSGYLYFLTIINQFSGYQCVKFLKHKSDTFPRFKEFKTESEKEKGRVLRMLVSDGGGEFLNDDFKTFCASEGIIHHVSPAYSPQNNGMAERANQTILVKAQCLLVQSKLPKTFWAEAVNTATHLSNLTPSATRKMNIPYKIWKGSKANLDVLQPFGCLTYLLIPKEQRTFKLFPTAEKGLFLGYENNFSSYRVYKLEDRKVVRVCNITFDEFNFPGLKDQEDADISDVFDTPPQTIVVFSNTIQNQESENAGIPTGSDSLSPSPTISKAPRDISSEISTNNILNVNQRGNQFLVYLTKNAECDTPSSYIQAINSKHSYFWKKSTTCTNTTYGS
jgi:hypothetical protein